MVIVIYCETESNSIENLTAFCWKPLQVTFHQMEESTQEEKIAKVSIFNFVSMF